MKYIKQLMWFIRDIFKDRKLINELTKKDFQARYLGSHLGIVWAFIQPTITILIFWFVFQVGFKSMPIDNFPFILWLMTGMIPWFFFNDTFLNATNCILEYKYLVSKVVFRVSVLPIIKIISGLFVHIFFVFFLFLMFFIYGYKPSIYNIQVIYYLLAMIVLLLGISWITSSLVVFLKDIGQFVSMIMQFAFWMTPIFWSINRVPAKYQFLLKLNPMYYIVEGYRSTFIYHHWFWEKPWLALYFWFVTLGLFIIGALLFRKLRPHFADVI